MKKSPKKQNKQNELFIDSGIKQKQTTPTENKTINFGKNIRARLCQKNQMSQRRIIQPLRENLSFQNLQKISYSTLNISSCMSIQNTANNEFYLDQYQQNQEFSRKQIKELKKVKFCETRENRSMVSQNKGNHSILKNTNSLDKISTSSVTSHTGSFIQKLNSKQQKKEASNKNYNYFSLLNTLVTENRKYFDQNFPPGSASLFYSKHLSLQHKDIQWMRIQDIYKGQKLVLYSHSDRNQIKMGDFTELHYMTTCFNTLATSNKLIQKIFQSQLYSRYGIYYLLINHQGIQKYVVVDDYIPVRKIKNEFVPTFLSVKTNKSKYIQIWPFILQKALAKIFSTYESLFGDTVQNLLFQLSGLFPKKINLCRQNMESISLQIKKYLLNEENMLFISSPRSGQYKQFSYPIIELKSKSGIYFSQQKQFRLISALKLQQNLIIDLQNLFVHFQNLHVVQQCDGFYSIGCAIKQRSGLFSLRTFKIQVPTFCTLAVIQKDKKHFRNNGYSYCWMRLILALKDIDGYRFIAASYDNKKTVSVQASLSPGQYYILINGDWINQKVYDITLTYLGNTQIQMNRQTLAKYSNIIPQVCRDMTQRFGRFTQINRNVCSYRYIDANLGLIIQDFNNQLQREVFFHKLYSKMLLQQFRNIGNLNFVQQQQHIQHQKLSKIRVDKNQNSRNCKLRLKKYDIQAFISPNSSKTMVLMTVGGTKQLQNQLFSFQQDL